MGRVASRNVRTWSVARGVGPFVLLAAVVSFACEASAVSTQPGTGGGSVDQTYPITGNIPVVRMGDTLQLRADEDSSGQAPVWSSSDTLVLNVDSTGRLEARRVGWAVVTARVATGDVSREISVIPAVLSGAGDIADCNGRYHDRETAQVLDTLPGWVFTAGDNTYPHGALAEYVNCYRQSWGRHRARTLPVVGNHDIEAENGAAYFGYFGAAAGEPGKGWYHRRLGTWHVLVLNSNYNAYNSPEQLQWLRDELAAIPRSACIMAIWHHPRFSSSVSERSEPRVAPFWRALEQAGADIIVTGHSHAYERFAPQLSDGRASDAGIRAFVIGTGGATLYPLGPRIANSVASQESVYGVVSFQLDNASYIWQFIGINGAAYADAGAGECHP